MTFDIDANGILNVSARDKDTGAEQTITITQTSNLDPKEVERMVEDAERHRADDARARELVDARNELDAVAYQVEKRLEEAGEQVPAHERQRAEMLVSDARQALNENADASRLRSLSAELQQIYQALAVSRSDGGSAQAPPDVGSRDDDVIDADFTVG